MAFKIAASSPNAPKMTYLADASTTFTSGNVVYRDTSSGELKEETGGAATTLTVEGVVNKTETTGSSSPTIDITPIYHGPIQLWVADCNANTATNQLNKAHDLTDAGTVDNTSTTDATTAGVFIAVAQVGAASDQQLLGYFVKVGQVTA